MNEVSWPVVGALAGAVGCLIAVVKFWIDIGKLAQMAIAASKKVDDIEKALTEFKQKVAAEYPSHGVLALSEKRMAESIDGLREDLRAMTARIDQVLALVRPLIVPPGP